MRALGKFFSFSFLWGFFQWFFTSGDGCGFANFPTFGLEAYENKYVNFSKLSTHGETMTPSQILIICEYHIKTGSTLISRLHMLVLE